MSSTTVSDEAEPIEYDPIFLNSRKEALVILCVWFVGLLWCVPYCYITGYTDHIDPQDVKMVWGVPTWVYWGIVVPWIVADVFTTWFCFCYMKDDDLGEAMEGADIEEEIAEMHAHDATDKETDS